MGLYPAFEIIGNAGIELSVLATQDIDMPRHGKLKKISSLPS
jgi:hypothetical protein